MQIRTLIVDDEPLARRGLVLRLARHADIEIVGEAGNGREAFFAISEHQPTLMFLDVQMPGVDGFELLRAGAGAAVAVDDLRHRLRPIRDEGVRGERVGLPVEADRRRTPRCGCRSCAARACRTRCRRPLRTLAATARQRIGPTRPDPGSGLARSGRRRSGRRSPVDQGCRPHPARGRSTISCGSTRPATTCACTRRPRRTCCARPCANWKAASTRAVSSASTARPSSTSRA